MFTSFLVVNTLPRQRSFVPFLLPDSYLYMTDYLVRVVFGQSLVPHLLLLFLGGLGNSFRVVFG